MEKHRADSIPQHVRDTVAIWRRAIRYNWRDPNGLTQTEGVVLRLIACGLTFKETAEIMGRSTSTIKKHIETTQQKTHARSIVLLTHYAIKHGYLKPGDHIDA